MSCSIHTTKEKLKVLNEKQLLYYNLNLSSYLLDHLSCGSNFTKVVSNSWDLNKKQQPHTPRQLLTKKYSVLFTHSLFLCCYLNATPKQFEQFTYVNRNVEYVCPIRLLFLIGECKKYCS